MPGFLATLGQLGQGMIQQQPFMNRYRQYMNAGKPLAQQARQPMGPPVDTQQSDAQTADDMQQMQNLPYSPAAPEAPGSPAAPPQPGAPTEDASGPMGYDNAARGTLITKPTIARVGEAGPEAIVPLNNAAGNKVRPDLLEGHLTPPKIPGMRYQNFKSYVKPSY